MRRIIIPILSAIFILISLPISTTSAAISDEKLNRLDVLGRIWGAARYFHPAVYQGEIDWDKAGEKAIDAAISASGRSAFYRAIADMLDQLGDPQTRVLTGQDSSSAEKDSRYRTQSEVGFSQLAEDVVLIHANDWNGIVGAAGSGSILMAAFFDAAIDKVGKTPLVIVDLRRFDAPHSGIDVGAIAIERAMESVAIKLSPANLLLPAPMQMLHSGFANERWRTDNYYSATMQRAHKPLSKQGDVPSDRFVVFIYDEQGSFVTPYSNAYASAGVGAAVLEGELLSGGSGQIVVPMLDDSALAIVGTSLLKNVDGSYGNIIASQLPTPNGPEVRDAAIEAAIETARSRLSGEPSQSGVRPILQIFDRAYTEQVKPTKAQRILAAFKLWNAVNYFFPYKSEMDHDWDPVLKASLSEFIKADDDITYAKALARMAAKIQDTHVTVGVPGYNKLLGIYTPNIATILVENDQLIVKEVVGQTLKDNDQIRVGDIVTKIDGEAVTDRIARLRPFVPASTSGSYKMRLESRLLAGVEGTSVSLVLQRKDVSRPLKVNLDRDTPFYVPTTSSEGLGRRDHPKMEMLEDEIAYYNIGRMSVVDNVSALELLFQSKGAIVDMRGYPNGGGYPLAGALAKERTPSATIVEPFIFQSANANPAWKTTLQYAEPGPRHFPGPVVLLVDHSGISAAEHFSMLIKSAGADRVTIVGMPTNGANGVITEINLPGGGRVTFTGMQAAWGDGTRLQRRGVVPDVQAEPTVESVRAGRDHVFEVGLQVLNDRIGNQE